jgi:taurine dioxygenase
MGEWQAQPLDAAFGVEIRGFEAEARHDDDAIRQLRTHFDEHGLVVFRDVDLGFTDQQSLVDMLVGAEQSLVDGRTATGEVVEEFCVTNEEDGPFVGVGRLLFHTDAMWSDDPFSLISLYGVRAAPDATPTMYASTARAWATLPDDLRARVSGLHAVHGEGQHTYDGDDYASHPGEQDRTRTTPVGMAHPRTGRTLLYVSEQQTRGIMELPRAESDELLAELRAHLYAPDNRLEHHWQQGDLVAWDNLTVQHARGDVQLHGPVRTLRKAVVPPPWLWSVEYAM